MAAIDVNEEGRIRYSFMGDLQRQLFLLDVHGPQNEGELAVWLDQSIPHPDITQRETIVFLSGLLRFLIGRRGFSFPELNSHRWRLRDALEAKISHYRRHVLEHAYQQMLLPIARVRWRSIPASASPTIP